MSATVAAVAPLASALKSAGGRLETRALPVSVHLFGGGDHGPMVTAAPHVFVRCSVAERDEARG
jgi:hypothetical protein